MIDHDWYFENVIVPGGPERAFVGPARRWQAAWDSAECRLRGSGSPADLLACGQGFVLTHAQARAVGVPRADVRRLVRRGAWTAPRRGVLCVLPRGDGAEPHGERPEIRAAALALVRPDTWISHESAAAAYGLPLLGRVARASVTRVDRTPACSLDDIVVRAAAVPVEDRATWFGAPILAPPRTIVDLSRASARAGIVAADAALREDLLSAADLRAAIGRASGWPGVVTARTVADLASPDVESPLESLVRLFLHQQGLPLPEPQAWVTTARGRYRVDGLWRDRGVVLEIDGLTKYRRGSDALVEEKRRQEFVERAGYRVVRVTWEDIHRRPAETAWRIREALRRGGYARAA